MKPWALLPWGSMYMIMFCSAGHTPLQEDIDLEPNPVYGISVPWESQTNSDQYALDHMHKTSGTTTDNYDYVY